MNISTLRSLTVQTCDGVEAVLRVAGGAAFVMFMATVVVQVVFRNFFRMNALIWTTELATFLFVWSVFIGSAIAVRHHRHYALEVVPKAWGRARRVARFSGLCGILVGAAILLDAGIDFLDVAARRIAIQMGLSQVWFYLAIPVGASGMLVFIAEKAILVALPVGADAPARARPADAAS